MESAEVKHCLVGEQNTVEKAEDRVTGPEGPFACRVWGAEQEVYLEGGAVGRIHDDKQRLPGEGEQVTWVKAAMVTRNNVRTITHEALWYKCCTCMIQLLAMLAMLSMDCTGYCTGSLGSEETSLPVILVSVYFHCISIVLWKSAAM